jgi:hypothetical protein
MTNPARSELKPTDNTLLSFALRALDLRLKFLEVLAHLSDNIVSVTTAREC